MLSRIVWSEGMYLAPHHFQAQARYFEHSVQFANASLWSEPYGLVAYQLDDDALRNGTVAVSTARGVFPDGLPFEMPASDALPVPRSVAELFPPTRDKLSVYLAIPAWVEGSTNCDVDSGTSDGARFIAKTLTLADENTGIDEKPVRVGKKNIRLLFDTEPTDGFSLLPLASVMRSGSGRFIYDPAFIPPCLQITASNRIMEILRVLIEIIEEKSATLLQARGNRGRFQAGMSSTDVATFWFLHTLNASLAPLRHLYYSKRGHPEEAFKEMSRLGAALCTFGLQTHPRSLPLYDHQDLQRCFDELNDHILRHLEIVVPTRTLSIALQSAGNYLWTGDITDQRCLDRAKWIFSIHSAIGEAELISKTPHLVKLCSAKFVPELVKRALPGLTLTHVPVPPSAIAAKVDHQYFLVNRAGPCWEHIVLTRQVGIYLPGELSDPELELLVIIDNN